MKIQITLTLLVLTLSVSAQRVMKLQDAEALYPTDSLQEIYFDRIFSDEISSCFDVSQEMFIVEWSKFTRAVARHLHNKNFIWGKQTASTINVYFNENEKIDHFFINIRDNSFTEERYTELFKLLDEFLTDYKFTIDAKIPFSNMGSITFYD